MVSKTLKELVEDNEDMFLYCQEMYMAAWAKTPAGKAGKEEVSESVRREAQSEAIDSAFFRCLVKYPGVDQDLIWKLVGAVHKYNLANLEEFGLAREQRLLAYDRCISAHQSWIKSGGHSFERYIAAIQNEKLEKNEIKFILQKDLTQEINNNELANTAADIANLKKWGSHFDLYATQTIHGETHVFGCIQSKTSIRDRVGRDLPFSREAMQNLFWSVAVTLDGAFLNMPEFTSMVNGDGEGAYTDNGWHGMYVMSGISDTNKRIYKTDEQLGLLAEHAVSAARQFISDRRQLDHIWMA